MIKNELLTDNYAIYNSDCMYVLPTLPDDSIDLSVYSPPFAGLYTYSSSYNDFSNCESKEHFLEQYEFLVKEMSRVTKPGRINAVHCQDVLTNVTKNWLWDFPHEIIEIHLRHGFHFVNRITIWKEPLEVRMRTMVRSLMHKNIVEDSTECMPAQPDYLLIFKKAGECKVKVEHSEGLSYYAGSVPLLPAMEAKYGDWNHLKIKYRDHKDPKTNKLSHIIWQRYASSVWDDIRNSEVLRFKDAREEDDEKHVHPLQLDVIDRVVELYSNPGETVLTPFMGVGSEVFSPVSMGRKAIGIELKDSYFKQAVKNMAGAGSRFDNLKDPELEFVSDLAEDAE
ncbi:MAG TPA: DNA methyltransferase [Flavobacteriales bacterium]|nr:DNA methyltransferase [Flavobacteriales bacterium]